MKRVLAITAAATVSGFASLLTLAASAVAIHPCQSYDPPPTCYEEDPAPPAPTAPASLTAPSVLQTSVTLQWADRSSTETAFNIRRVVGSATTSYFSVAANSTSFTDTSAPAGSYIEYFVSAERCTYDYNCSSSASVRIAVHTYQQPAYPIGVLTSDTVTDSSSHYYLAGWALDFDTVAPIQVSLVVDGVVAQTTTANTAYSGLNARYPGYGDSHGFSFNGVKSTVKGTHTVCVRAINVGGGADTPVTCSSYVVP